MREYNKKEIDFIKEHYGKESLEELSKALNRTKGSISSFISRYDLRYEFILEEKEEIREIFNGKYFITNFGRIFSNRFKEMKPYESGGYLRITLSPTFKKKEKFFIHRLVAETFLEKEEGKDFVNHKDMNKKNNRLENLEWVSHSFNEKHKFNNKPELKLHLSLINKKENNLEKEKVNIEVNLICKLLKEGMRISEISKLTNINEKRISAIKNKRLWKSISDKYF